MVERLVKFADRLLFMKKKGGPFQQASTIKLRIKTMKPGIIHTATIRMVLRNAPILQEPSS